MLQARSGSDLLEAGALAALSNLTFEPETGVLCKSPNHLFNSFYQKTRNPKADLFKLSSFVLGRQSFVSPQKPVCGLGKPSPPDKCASKHRSIFNDDSDDEASPADRTGSRQPKQRLSYIESEREDPDREAAKNRYSHRAAPDMPRGASSTTQDHLSNAQPPGRIETTSSLPKPHTGRTARQESSPPSHRRAALPLPDSKRDAGEGSNGSFNLVAMTPDRQPASEHKPGFQPVQSIEKNHNFSFRDSFAAASGEPAQEKRGDAEDPRQASPQSRSSNLCRSAGLEKQSLEQLGHQEAKRSYRESRNHQRFIGSGTGEGMGSKHGPPQPQFHSLHESQTGEGSPGLAPADRQQPARDPKQRHLQQCDLQKALFQKKNSLEIDRRAKNIQVDRLASERAAHAQAFHKPALRQESGPRLQFIFRQCEGAEVCVGPSRTQSAAAPKALEEAVWPRLLSLVEIIDRHMPDYRLGDAAYLDVDDVLAILDRELTAERIKRQTLARELELLQLQTADPPAKNWHPVAVGSPAQSAKKTRSPRKSPGGGRKCSLKEFAKTYLHKKMSTLESRLRKAESSSALQPQRQAGEDRSGQKADCREHHSDLKPLIIKHPISETISRIKKFTSRDKPDRDPDRASERNASPKLRASPQKASFEAKRDTSVNSSYHLLGKAKASSSLAEYYEHSAPTPAKDPPLSEPRLGELAAGPGGAKAAAGKPQRAVQAASAQDGSLSFKRFSDNFFRSNIPSSKLLAAKSRLKTDGDSFISKNSVLVGSLSHLQPSKPTATIESFLKTQAHLAAGPASTYFNYEAERTLRSEPRPPGAPESESEKADRLRELIRKPAGPARSERDEARLKEILAHSKGRHAANIKYGVKASPEKVSITKVPAVLDSSSKQQDRPESRLLSFALERELRRADSRGSRSSRPALNSSK